MPFTVTLMSQTYVYCIYKQIDILCYFTAWIRLQYAICCMLYGVGVISIREHATTINLCWLTSYQVDEQPNEFQQISITIYSQISTCTQSGIGMSFFTQCCVKIRLIALCRIFMSNYRWEEMGRDEQISFLSHIFSLNTTLCEKKTSQSHSLSVCVCEYCGHFSIVVWFYFDRIECEVICVQRTPFVSKRILNRKHS